MPNATTDASMPGEPLPVELMNTIWADRDGVHDALDGASAASRWLVAQALIPKSRAAAAVTSEQETALITLRDAFRRLASEVTHDDRTAGQSPVQTRSKAVAIVNAASANTPTWPELAGTSKPSAVIRCAGNDTDAALNKLAQEGVLLFGGSAREELRACHAPGCVLYFIRDHPRRQWCSAACGNRARVARHYEAHRGATQRGASA